MARVWYVSYSLKMNLLRFSHHNRIPSGYGSFGETAEVVVQLLRTELSIPWLLLLASTLVRMTKQIQLVF